MFKDFDKMPMLSRVWIYQSNRPLTAKEENIVHYTLKGAIEQWNAHGVPLLGSVQVLQSRFVIVALDENMNQASGCSIDASTHWLKKLGEELSVDFFDRSLIYEKDGLLESAPVFGLKAVVESGAIGPETVVFNSLGIQNISQLQTAWKVQADKFPFLAKFFSKQVA